MAERQELLRVIDTMPDDPVSQMCCELKKLDLSDKDSLKNILKKVDIAWITKEERDKLDKKYKSKRADNPWCTLKDVGIEMVDWDAPQCRINK